MKAAYKKTYQETINSTELGIHSSHIVNSWQSAISVYQKLLLYFVVFKCLGFSKEPKPYLQML